MRNLPLALRQAKNSIDSDSPWLILLDIVLNNGPTYNIVNNNEDVEFQNKVYTAFPFKLEPPKETSQGDIPKLKLMVSNITRVIQTNMEELNGGIGSIVTLYIVNYDLLDEDYSELTMDFEVLASACDAQWITFELGAPNPLRRRFPTDRYIANHCNFQYKSAECGYGGNLTTCKRTLTDCRAHGNSVRFGGFPGLAPGSTRFV